MSDRPRALVIDDDKDFAEYVQTVLESQGYETYVATDGRTGVEIAREKRPLVILVDLLMGPEDGFAVCRDLRQSPLTRGAGILVVTGIRAKLHKTFESPDVGAKLDADGFLDKPVDVRTLVDTVNGVLNLARSRTDVAGENP